MMLVTRRAFSWTGWAVFGLTSGVQIASGQSYPPAQYQAQPAQQYPAQPAQQYPAQPQQQFQAQPQPQYQGQSPQQTRPQSAYAVQPRPGYGAGNASPGQQIPTQINDPYRAMPAQAVAPGAAAPGQSYPAAQQIPAGQQPPAGQQFAPAQQYPSGQAGAAQGYGAGQQPVRLAQQPGAAGQTLSTSSSDMSIPPMETGPAPPPPPMGNEGAPAAVPVDLNPPMGAATEHPLAPAIRWASSEVANIRALRDYSCIFYKRERIDGQLGGYQAMYMKVRHEPFSVYMYFKSPSNLEGQEVIYVKGLNDNNLQAHTTGIKSVVGTVSLSPTGTMAMKGNRYPITEAGMLNLLDRLVAVGNKDMQFGECDVQFFTSQQGVKVGGRPCTCIQVTHPVPRRNFLFHQARIYVDEELRLPIRYESYDWPTQPGGPPLLMEEYTYQNLKLNNGFTDLDFDVRNPKYGFK